MHVNQQLFLFRVQFLGEPLINGNIRTTESRYPNGVKQKKEHLKAIRFCEELKLPGLPALERVSRSSRRWGLGGVAGMEKGSPK